MEKCHPLQILREDLGWNQAELAEALGNARSAIAMVETKRNPCSRAMSLAVADNFRRRMERLDIDVEDLLRGELR